MDSFNVIISPAAFDQLSSYIEYLQFTLLNEQAAKSVWKDAIDTANELSNIAGGLKLCTHPVLRDRGYHLIHFKKHNYVMLYKITGKDVYVSAIYHTLQDYENLFSESITGGE